MCGCSKGNVRNFKIVLNSKNARQVQNGICLVVTKTMFEIRYGRIYDYKSRAGKPTVLTVG